MRAHIFCVTTFAAAIALPSSADAAQKLTVPGVTRAKPIQTQKIMVPPINSTRVTPQRIQAQRVNSPPINVTSLRPQPIRVTSSKPAALKVQGVASSVRTSKPGAEAGEGSGSYRSTRTESALPVEITMMPVDEAKPLEFPRAAVDISRAGTARAGVADTVTRAPVQRPRSYELGGSIEISRTPSAVETEDE